MSRSAPLKLSEDGVDPKEEVCDYCFITYNKSLGQCPECTAEGRPPGWSYAQEREVSENFRRRALMSIPA